MASLAELARNRTELDEDSIDHLQRLVGVWALLADLSFTDLVLYAPTNSDGAEFVVLAHVRSTTGPTIHPIDPVGDSVTAGKRPHLFRVLTEGRRVEDLVLRPPRGVELGDGDVVEEITLAGPGRRLVVDSMPVRRDCRIVATLCRESEPALMRHAGALERTYRALYDRIGHMIEEGDFPYERFERIGEFREPRVGDGVLVVDSEGRIEYGSPNAVSAFHRLGVRNNVEGSRLGELGLDETVVRRAFALRRSTVSELESASELTVVVRCYPLIEGGRVTGAIALLRDISELRHRDRLLLTKDATIQEIHHRVKNNLQTISALLRLQARRVGNAEARAAVEESVRRIASIALVHETLALDTSDAVDFDRVIAPVVRMVEDALGAPDRPLRVDIEGSLGEVPGEVAMPMALVVTELVQNAIDHAAPEGGTVAIGMEVTPSSLVLKVSDSGPGVPDGFSFDRDAGLGLTIVRTFVVHDLGGTISVRAASVDRPRGTVVEVTVPRARGELPMG
jgi:two-component sensor histidine kinase